MDGAVNELVFMYWMLFFTFAGAVLSVYSLIAEERNLWQMRRNAITTIVGLVFLFIAISMALYVKLFGG